MDTPFHSFPTVFNREMGLQLNGDDLSSFLCIGVTFTSFQMMGSILAAEND